jgi:hypothetical protein
MLPFVVHRANRETDAQALKFSAGALRGVAK